MKIKIIEYWCTLEINTAQTISVYIHYVES